MPATEYSFKIIICLNCPLYKRGDRFTLSEMALNLPLNKPTCLVLARDMTELLFSLNGSAPHGQEAERFNCSGCQGLIKFEMTETKEDSNRQDHHLNISFSGHLQELPPEELLQTLNVNQKTGTLILDLPDGTATAAFKNGQIISVSHKEREDSEAFFMLLKEKEGDFHFSRLLPPSLDHAVPIGNFMNLLMEGLQKIDEET